MASYIGRLINIGFSKEKTRGTAEAVANFYPKTDLSFQNKNTKVKDEAGYGTINTNSNAYTVNEWAEGTIDMNLGIEAIALPLLALFGNVTSSETTGTGAYEHIFDIAESNNHQSLTIGLKDEVGSKSFALAMIESMTITANVGEFATVSIDFKSKKSTDVVHTVSYGVDYQLLVKSGFFKLADNLAGLDAADNKCIQNFEITISKNLEPTYCFGSTEPTDFVNKNLTIEGSFTAEYENETDYENTAFSDDTKAMRVGLIDTNTTIGVSDNPTLQFDLAKVTLEEFDKSQGNDETVKQTVNFVGMYSLADDGSIGAKLINETATY